MSASSSSTSKSVKCLPLPKYILEDEVIPTYYDVYEHKPGKENDPKGSIFLMICRLCNSFVQGRYHGTTFNFHRHLVTAHKIYIESKGGRPRKRRRRAMSSRASVKRKTMGEAEVKSSTSSTPDPTSPKRSKVTEKCDKSDPKLKMTCIVLLGDRATVQRKESKQSGSSSKNEEIASVSIDNNEIATDSTAPIGVKKKTMNAFPALTAAFAQETSSTVQTSAKQSPAKAGFSGSSSAQSAAFNNVRLQIAQARFREKMQQQPTDNIARRGPKKKPKAKPSVYDSLMKKLKIKPTSLTSPFVAQSQQKEKSEDVSGTMLNEESVPIPSGFAKKRITMSPAKEVQSEDDTNSVDGIEDSGDSPGPFSANSPCSDSSDKSDYVPLMTLRSIRRSTLEAPAQAAVRQNDLSIQDSNLIPHPPVVNGPLPSKESRSYCFLCNKVSEPKNRDNWLLIGQLYEESLCRLLDLPLKSFENVFVDANYCDDCNKRISEVALSLKELDRVQKSVNEKANGIVNVLKATFQTRGKQQCSDSKTDPLCRIVEQLETNEKAKNKVEEKSSNKECRSAQTQTSKLDFENETAGRKMTTSGSSEKEVTCILMNDSKVSTQSEKKDESHSVWKFFDEIEIEDRYDAREQNDVDPLADTTDQQQSQPELLMTDSVLGCTKYRCYHDGCTYITMIAENLEVHLRRVHQGDKEPFKCKDCPFTCKSKESLKAHRSSAHKYIIRHIPAAEDGNGNETYEYVYSYSKSSDASTTFTLANTTGVSSGEKGKFYVCDLCSKIFTLEKSLKLHQRLHCKESSTSAPASFNSNESSFHCSKCRLNFLSEQSFETHRCQSTLSHSTFRNLTSNISENYESAPNKCTDRPGTVNQADRSSLSSRSVARNSNGESYSCLHKQCFEQFTSEDLLNKHMCSMHSIDGEFGYFCYKCSGQFRFCTELKQHLQQHIGAMVHTCKICNLECSSKALLLTHMNSHSHSSTTQLKLALFSCNICSKTFDSDEDYKSHYDSHVGTTTDQGLTCTICRRTFKLQRSLNLHMRIHEKKPQESECTILQSSSLTSRSNTTNITLVSTPCLKTYSGPQTAAIRPRTIEPPAVATTSAGIHNNQHQPAAAQRNMSLPITFMSPLPVPIVNYTRHPSVPIPTQVSVPTSTTGYLVPYNVISIPVIQAAEAPQSKN